MSLSASFFLLVYCFTSTVLKYFSRLASHISTQTIFTWKFILKSEAKILVNTELSCGMKSYVNSEFADFTYILSDSKMVKYTSPVSAARFLTNWSTH